MNALMFYATLLLYLAATVCYLVYLVKPRPATGTASRWLITAGFVLHAAFTLLRYIQDRHTPITNLHESLSFFSLSVVGVFIFFERRFKILVLGSFVSPVALILMGISSLFPSTISPLNPALKSKWLVIHTSLAFLGYASFAVAFGLTLLAAWVDSLRAAARSRREPLARPR